MWQLEFGRNFYGEKYLKAKNYRLNLKDKNSIAWIFSC